METEQWLEEAVLMTNRSLRLVPASVLRQSIKSGREHGAALVSMAGAGNQMGVIDGGKVTELQERIPEPAKIRPQPNDVRATKQTCRVEIESCRFWINCMMGATKEMPVIFDLQPTDQKTDENIRGILGDLADQIKQDGKESH